MGWEGGTLCDSGITPDGLAGKEESVTGLICKICYWF